MRASIFHANASGYDKENRQLGHAWVIDGHGSMTCYAETLYNKKIKKTITQWMTLSNCLMVHCNMGWDGNANGWYVYGIFDTRNRPLVIESAALANPLYGENYIEAVPFSVTQRVIVKKNRVLKPSARISGVL
jgi:hypothetical protein